jgi:phosphoribosylformimino-5-aminoimidazole carboxamide ribotide isomerase
LRIVPVIDLFRGEVVRARHGDRAHYRPIDTPLARSSDPVDVVRGLLGVYPFATLYAADLDAIQRSGDNSGALRRMRAAFPGLRLWVDNGAASDGAIAALAAPDLACEAVLGSESQRDGGLIARCRESSDVLLSLDFRSSAFQGPPEILAAPQTWPRRVIVMTLARVGSGAGPDLERLGAIRAIAEGREIYAAGGVRDAADLGALAAAGVAGALVASALHERRLTCDALDAWGDHSFLPSGPNCFR